MEKKPEDDGDNNIIDPIMVYIYNSNDKKTKYTAEIVYINDETYKVKFGQYGAEDFTNHKDES